MALYQYVVLARPKNGREDEFDKWYDGKHLGDMIRVPGVISAKRFRIVKQMVTDKKGNMVTDQDDKFATTNLDLPNWYSLVIYEIDAENPRDADDIVAEVIKVAGTEALPFTSSMNWEGMTQFVAEPMGTATKA